MSRFVCVGAASASFALYAIGCNAEIRLASDWKHSLSVPSEQWDGTKLKNAMFNSAFSLSATSTSRNGIAYKPAYDPGFSLYADGSKYYIQPALFMPKDRPDEVCTPVNFDKAHPYRCEEGQSFKESCHLMLFNAQFENVGVYRFRPQEPYETFCNAVPAIGVADKVRNELFVTFQYFPIDRKVAGKVSEIGSGWKRMTSLLRVKQVDGKITVEDDDSCLGNPNAIETIPDARAALKRCRSASK